MPILGSTWIIGVFAVNEHTEFIQWIFTILNSIQVCYFYNSCIFKFVYFQLGSPYIFLLCTKTRKG